MGDESDPLLRNEGSSLGSYSAHSDNFETISKMYKQRWRSVRVIYFTVFLSCIAFSICMASIYPFLQRLDPTSSTSVLGWVVASYSLGQLIASPFFGWWANRRKSTREPLVASMIIFTAANVLYAYMQDFSSNRVALLIAARALIGFGTGNTAVMQSYVAGATTLKERTSAMANIAAAQALGFVLGPAIQTAFVPLGYPGPVHEDWLQLNVYTAPALLSAILEAGNIALLLFVFFEFRVPTEEEDDTLPSSSGAINSKVMNGDSTNSEMVSIQTDVAPDMVAAVGCMLLFFIILFMFSIFETISTPLSTHMFDWTNEQSTLYVGLILLGAGVISVIDFQAVKLLSQRYDERRLLIISLVICSVGYFGYLPWGDVTPDIRPDVINQGNSSLPANGTTAEPVGCPANYQWCYTTPKIYLWQMIICTVVVAIGYASSSVFAYSIFSKVLGPKPQGTMMGWQQAAGCLARTVGPVFVTSVYETDGPRITFSIAAAVVVCGVILTLVLFKRLVPYQTRVKDVVARSAMQSSAYN